MMPATILVTYASQGGATAGVAEAIGNALASPAVLVRVLPLKEVADLSPYRAVIIGSAVHSGKWLPEAVTFVERNQARLRQIPTAVFQVCMMLATADRQYEQMVPTWLAPVRALIHPVAEGSFAGALWPNRYSKFSEKIGLHLFLAFVKLKAGDYRDWNKIKQWADSLRPKIGL